jgi:hypothetical protein
MTREVKLHSFDEDRAAEVPLPGPLAWCNASGTRRAVVEAWSRSELGYGWTVRAGHFAELARGFAPSVAQAIADASAALLSEPVRVYRVEGESTLYADKLRARGAAISATKLELRPHRVESVLV